MERPAAPVEMPGMRLPRGLLALYTLGALEAALPLVAPGVDLVVADEHRALQHLANLLLQ